MKLDRKKFIQSAAIGAAALGLPKLSSGKVSSFHPSINNPFDPWLEIDAAALKANAKTVHELSGKKPILAVIKNNGYGLGAEIVAKILQEVPVMKKNILPQNQHGSLRFLAGMWTVIFVLLQ